RHRRPQRGDGDVEVDEEPVGEAGRGVGDRPARRGLGGDRLVPVGRRVHHHRVQAAETEAGVGGGVGGRGGGAGGEVRGLVAAGGGVPHLNGDGRSGDGGRGRSWAGVGGGGGRGGADLDHAGVAGRGAG